MRQVSAIHTLRHHYAIIYRHRNGRLVARYVRTLDHWQRLQAAKIARMLTSGVRRPATDATMMAERAEGENARHAPQGA